MSLKIPYLVDVNNVRSTAVSNMEQLPVFLPRSYVQLTNLPFPELSRVPLVSLRVLKYIKVSSLLKTLRKRLGPPGIANADQRHLFPSVATDSTAVHLSLILLYAIGWFCKHML